VTRQQALRLRSGQALRRAAALLAEAGIDEAALEAEVLLRHALSLDRTQLYLRLGDELPAQADSAYQASLQRRLQREPTAYIVGHKEFYGLALEVGPGVTIPRPETELLVEEALTQARRMLQRAPSVTIVDVGTGCGGIALALASHLPAARVIATDVSPAALSFARRNAETLGLTPHVCFICGDLLSPLRQPIDVIVANLPYVKSSAWLELAPEIRCHEPRQALDGGPDGLRLIERLLRQAPTHLRPGGAVLLEIGYDQGPAATALAAATFPKAAIAVKKDLASLDRMLVVQL